MSNNESEIDVDIDIVIPKIQVERRNWLILDYKSKEELQRSIVDWNRRVIYYPAVVGIEVGSIVDIEIVVGDFNIHFPMTTQVIANRSNPYGHNAPQGLYFEVIAANAERFELLYRYAQGNWRPGSRRSSPRIRTELKVSYYLPPKFYSAETIDISVDGVYLRTDGPMQDIGKGIYIKIKPHGLWRPIPLSARVCWINGEDSRRGMGLYCFDPKKGLRRLAELVEDIQQKNLIK
jgi:hypothetical protein